MSPSEDSDQPAHSRSLIRIFTGRILDSQDCKVSSCEHQWLWTDCGNAQADLSLRLAHDWRYVFARGDTFPFNRNWMIRYIVSAEEISLWAMAESSQTNQSVYLPLLHITSHLACRVNNKCRKQIRDCLFFLENRLWHFIQTVCSLHEMPKPIF